MLDSIKDSFTESIQMRQQKHCQTPLLMQLKPWSRVCSMAIKFYVVATVAVRRTLSSLFLAF